MNQPVSPIYFWDSSNPWINLSRHFTSAVLQARSLEEISFLFSRAKQLSPDLSATFVGHCLWQAVASNQRNVILGFLQQGGDINIWYRGATMLHESVTINNASQVRFLLSLPDIDKDCRDINAVTPVMIATKGLYDCLKVLLEAGCNPNVQDRKGNPVFHQQLCTCAGGMTYDMMRCMGLLLQYGADINGYCFKGKTPLHKAVEHQAYSVIAWLLYNNADVNKYLDGRSIPYLNCCQRAPFTAMGIHPHNNLHALIPMFMAVLSGNKLILKVLIACGSDYRGLVGLIKTAAPKDSILSLLKNYFTRRPASLKSLCRTVVRRNLSSQIATEIKTLELPRCLEAYVMCTDEIMAFQRASRRYDKYFENRFMPPPQ